MNLLPSESDDFSAEMECLLNIRPSSRGTSAVKSDSTQTESPCNRDWIIGTERDGTNLDICNDTGDSHGLNAVHSYGCNLYHKQNRVGEGAGSPAEERRTDLTSMVSRYNTLGETGSPSGERL